MVPLGTIIIGVVVCGSTWCEPIQFKHTQDYYYSTSGDGVYKHYIYTPNWCENSAVYYLTDHTQKNDEEAPYLSAQYVGVRGLVFLPDTVMCWPQLGGPE